MKRRKEAQASAACEGIYLSDEEQRLFEYMEEQALDFNECDKLIDLYLSDKLKPLPWEKP